VDDLQAIFPRQLESSKWLPDDDVCRAIRVAHYHLQSPCRVSAARKLAQLLSEAIAARNTRLRRHSNRSIPALSCHADVAPGVPPVIMVAACASRAHHVIRCSSAGHATKRATRGFNAELPRRSPERASRQPASFLGCSPYLSGVVAAFPSPAMVKSDGRE
jgi:hypothetical protein